VQVVENPEFSKLDDLVVRKLLSSDPKMKAMMDSLVDPKLKAMMDSLADPKKSEELTARLQVMRGDPQYSDVLTELQQDGPMAIPRCASTPRTQYF
jgi:hypothetical protein